VLAQAIAKGAATKDFFGTAYAQNGDEYEGFKFGDSNVQLDDTLLLIEPDTAKKFEATLAAKAAAASTASSQIGTASPPAGNYPTAGNGAAPAVAEPPGSAGSAQPKARAFYGSTEVSAATAKMRFVQIAEEVVAALVSDPNANVKITVEISAEFPKGVSDQVKRAVSENANSLGFKTKTWE